MWQIERASRPMPILNLACCNEFSFRTNSIGTRTCYSDCFQNVLNICLNKLLIAFPSCVCPYHPPFVDGWPKLRRRILTWGCKCTSGSTIHAELLVSQVTCRCFYCRKVFKWTSFMLAYYLLIYSWKRSLTEIIRDFSMTIVSILSWTLAVSKLLEVYPNKTSGN